MSIETTQGIIRPVSIEGEMKRSYLDYAMSVIIARALPDVRDGLKPVHRRILHAMHENSYFSTRPYRKSARIVGEVMGKYHPHGDSAIYEALVRMAQVFSMRVPLIDGQGNFGSMDGDKAAAMRYTESRLQKIAETLLQDIGHETVSFKPNYDESEQEPVVLPATFPNLLANGANGIAVGMATNIPPHNLGELLSACIHLTLNPEATLAEVNQIIPGPDFPTGGIILGRSGIQDAYKVGRGSIVVRARTAFETVNHRDAIIVTELPYQVNKARTIERIAAMVRDKQMEGITDIRDESDRHGVRVVFELKKEASCEVVEAQLFHSTPLQTSFSANVLALDEDGKPTHYDLLKYLRAFLRFREEVLSKRTFYLLQKARVRAHELLGLLCAVRHLDRVIELIRRSTSPREAREALCSQTWEAGFMAAYIRLIDDPSFSEEAPAYRLSEAQAVAILDLRLHRLTALERDKITQEFDQLAETIRHYQRILADRDFRLELMRQEFQDLSDRFATPRRTEIQEAGAETDIEDLIEPQDVVVVVTRNAYIKRVPLSEFRSQRRGGRGRSGTTTRDDDVVANLFVANTHSLLLVFTDRGQVYSLKVWRLPQGTRASRGRALVNCLPLEPGETVWTLLPVPADALETPYSIVMATSFGSVRRNTLDLFTNLRKNGKIAIQLKEEERLVGVELCTEAHDILLCSAQGRAVRFSLASLRIFQSTRSAGVGGIRLASGDRLVSLCVLNRSSQDTETRHSYLRFAALSRRQEAFEAATAEAAEAETEAETEAAVSSAEGFPTPAPADDEEESEEAPVSLGDGPLKPEEYEELQAGREKELFRQLEQEEEWLLTIAENGFGKRTSSYEYRHCQRYAKGVKAMNVDGTSLLTAFPVSDRDHIMMITDAGQTIRVPVAGIRPAGRVTRGVRLFRTAEKERLISVARVEAAMAAEETADATEAEATAETAAETAETNPAGPGQPTAPAEAHREAVASIEETEETTR